MVGPIRRHSPHDDGDMEMQRPLLVSLALSDGVPRRSLYTAFVVGTILNLINQGDDLFSGQSVNVAKAVMTYAVPYAVATYGAVAARLHALRATMVRPEG
jgi:hypothetical protein